MRRSLRGMIRATRNWFRTVLPRKVARVWYVCLNVEDLVAREIKHWGMSRASLWKRFTFWRKGFLCESAILYGVESAEELDTYLSDFRRWVRSGGINKSHSVILGDKFIFFMMLRSITDRVASVIGLVEGARYLPVAGARVTVPVPLLDGLRGLEERVVLKPSQGSHGRGIMFYENVGDSQRVNGQDVPWATLEKMLNEDTFVVSPFVQQADYAAKIYPKTTNTIRMLTMWDYEKGEPFVCAAVNRFGSEMSGLVDNFSAGGLSVAIDPVDGRLGRGATVLNNKVVWLTEHPDTGVKMTGIPIPQWSTIRKEMLQIARAIPFLPYVAWDLLPTESGFCIIEGNARCDVNLLQVHGGLLTDDRVRHFYEHHSVLRKTR